VPTDPQPDRHAHQSADQSAVTAALTTTNAD
jgi:hypothetical protein